MATTDSFAVTGPPCRRLVGQTAGQPIGAGDRRRRVPGQPFHEGRIAQARVQPDRIDHGLGGGERDGRLIPRCHDLVFPGVDRTPLMVARTAQPIRPSAPPGTGRPRLTRSPARHPSRNADAIRRCPMAFIETSRTSVSRNASSTTRCLARISAVPVDRWAQTTLPDHHAWRPAGPRPAPPRHAGNWPRPVAGEPPATPGWPL
jgi:hypothetical protein